VIADGMSWTSITTDNSSTPITVNHLPANELVTVQTVLRDVQTNQETIIQNVLTSTGSVEIPVIPNSRDSDLDLATIATPQSQVIVNGDAKSATISFAPIENLDSSKTLVSIVVVGPGGSTTSIGVGGSGGSVTVSDLGAAFGYTVKMVIRDLNSGEETVISGGII
jgi:hypothetical protein